MGRKELKPKSKPLMRLLHSLTYGNIWLAALSLMKRKKVYAYTLPDEISKAFGYAPSRLMTYFVLYKLEQEGLIASSFVGRRKYYRITPAGSLSLHGAKSLLSYLSKRL